MNTETTLDVMNHPIVLASIEFMQDAHRNHAISPDPVLGGQRRKYSKAAYEVHPLQVGKMVSKTIHGDPITVAVAIMHDVFEDTHYGPGELREFFGTRFGNDVALALIQGVSEVTDVSKPEDGNRKVRKDLDKEHAWRATPERQTVKVLDIKSNMNSIVRNDPGFARKWVQEKADVLEGLNDADPQALAQVREQVAAYFARTYKPDPEWEAV